MRSQRRGKRCINIEGRLCKVVLRDTSITMEGNEEMLLPSMNEIDGHENREMRGGNGWVGRLGR